eukprot:jgi/Tetstr1/464408/TSEL_009201.t2
METLTGVYNTTHAIAGRAFHDHCVHDLGFAVRREVDDLFRQAVPLGNIVPMDELKDLVLDAELSFPAFNDVIGSLKPMLPEFKSMRPSALPGSGRKLIDAALHRHFAQTALLLRTFGATMAAAVAGCAAPGGDTELEAAPPFASLPAEEMSKLKRRINKELSSQEKTAVKNASAWYMPLLRDGEPEALAVRVFQLLQKCKAKVHHTHWDTLNQVWVQLFGTCVIPGSKGEPTFSPVSDTALPQSVSAPKKVARCRDILCSGKASWMKAALHAGHWLLIFHAESTGTSRQASAALPQQASNAAATAPDASSAQAAHSAAAPAMGNIKQESEEVVKQESDDVIEILDSDDADGEAVMDGLCAQNTATSPPSHTWSGFLIEKVAQEEKAVFYMSLEANFPLPKPMKLLMTGYTEMTPLDEQGDSFTMRLMNTQDAHASMGYVNLLKHCDGYRVTAGRQDCKRRHARIVIKSPDGDREFLMALPRTLSIGCQVKCFLPVSGHVLPRQPSQLEPLLPLPASLPQGMATHPPPNGNDRCTGKLPLAATPIPVAGEPHGANVPREIAQDRQHAETAPGPHTACGDHRAAAPAMKTEGGELSAPPSQPPLDAAAGPQGSCDAATAASKSFIGVNRKRPPVDEAEQQAGARLDNAARPAKCPRAAEDYDPIAPVVAPVKAQPGDEDNAAPQILDGTAKVKVDIEDVEPAEEVGLPLLFGKAVDRRAIGELLGSALCAEPSTLLNLSSSGAAALRQELLRVTVGGQRYRLTVSLTPERPIEPAVGGGEAGINRGEPAAAPAPAAAVGDGDDELEEMLNRQSQETAWQLHDVWSEDTEYLSKKTYEAQVKGAVVAVPKDCLMGGGDAVCLGGCARKLALPCPEGERLVTEHGDRFGHPHIAAFGPRVWRTVRYCETCIADTRAVKRACVTWEHTKKVAVLPGVCPLSSPGSIPNGSYTCPRCKVTLPPGRTIAATVKKLISHECQP